MKIWHDDLGMQNDLRETKVLYQSDLFLRPPILSRVTRGDCAVAAMGPEAWGGACPRWYRTVYDLMLAGF